MTEYSMPKANMKQRKLSEVMVDGSIIKKIHIFYQFYFENFVVGSIYKF